MAKTQNQEQPDTNDQALNEQLTKERSGKAPQNDAITDGSMSRTEGDRAAHKTQVDGDAAEVTIRNGVGAEQKISEKEWRAKEQTLRQAGWEDAKALDAVDLKLQ